MTSPSEETKGILCEVVQNGAFQWCLFLMYPDGHRTWCMESEVEPLTWAEMIRPFEVSPFDVKPF